MATFLTFAGQQGNMFLLLQGTAHTISEFDAISGTTARVTYNDLGPLNLYYTGGGFTFSLLPPSPTGGFYSGVLVAIGVTSVGVLANISPNANFADIVTLNAYHVFDGNDSLNGGELGDTLLGGFGGNDVFSGGGGNGVVDEYYVGAQATVPLHAFHGSASATDIIRVVNNIFTGETALDLRNATMESIDGLRVESGGSVTLKSSQFDAGLSAALAVEKVGAAAAASLLIQMDDTSLDLRGLSVTGVEISISGSALADTIFGTGTADDITGGDGNDVLDGSGGADYLYAALGADLMTGGLGTDRFDFDAVVEIGKKPGLRDIIADFADGDIIDLSTIDANGLKKGDKAFKFLKKEGANFTDKAGQLAWDQKKGVTLVQGDIDGNGKADFRLELTGLVALDKGDFLL